MREIRVNLGRGAFIQRCNTINSHRCCQFAHKTHYKTYRIQMKHKRIHLLIEVASLTIEGMQVETEYNVPS